MTDKPLPKHYIRSNGDLAVIAEMPFPHLKAAAEKLRREIGGNPHPRADELEAMDQQLAKLQAEYKVQLEQERETADPARVAEIDEILAKIEAGVS